MPDNQMPITITVVQLGHKPIIGRTAIIKTNDGKWRQTAVVTKYSKNVNTVFETNDGARYKIVPSAYNAGEI